jgi:hypothetical protein
LPGLAFRLLTLLRVASLALQDRIDLLNFTIQAHGGIERWQSVDSIDVDFD